MNSATARVLSAVVLLPLLILLVWKATPFAFNLVLAAAFVVAVRELRALVSNIAVGLLLVVAYLAFPISLLSVIRVEYGPGALMAMIGLIVVSDSAQYYTGRAFGRRKRKPLGQHIVAHRGVRALLLLASQRKQDRRIIGEPSAKLGPAQVLERVVVCPDLPLQRHYWGTVKPSPGGAMLATAPVRSTTARSPWSTV